jgi:tetratricopeptide (TPR) repeat protein
MNSKVIIAANVITLMVVAFVGAQMKGFKQGNRPSVTARGSLNQAQAFEAEGQFQKASSAYSQAERIGTTGIQAVAKQGRLRMDAAALVTAVEIPGKLVPQIRLLVDRLKQGEQPNPQWGALLEVILLDIADSKAEAIARSKVPLQADAVERWRPWVAATIYLRNHSWPDALTALNTVLSKPPVFVPALYHRADVLKTLGRHAEAIDGFERYLAQARDDPREKTRVEAARSAMRAVNVPARPSQSP